MADHQQTTAWPLGCHDTASCERHRVCMYHQCRHTGKGAALGKEIDAATMSRDRPKTIEPFERDTGQVTLSDEAADEVAQMLTAIERDGLTDQQKEASRRIRGALDRMKVINQARSVTND